MRYRAFVLPPSKPRAKAQHAQHNFWSYTHYLKNNHKAHLNGEKVSYRKISIWIITLFNLFAIGLNPLTSFAQSSARAAPIVLFEFNIPPNNLANALSLLAQQANTPALFQYNQLTHITARPIIGRYSLEDALSAITKDTAIIASVNNKGVITVKKIPPQQPIDPPNPIINPKKPNQQLEEVLVTGYRASLQNSLTIKRKSLHLSEIISAEDIGKFPDNNIAESLQRTTGIAIERNGGEGQYITVRGFGPEFNAVHMNNRTLATDSQVRGFSFDIVPAELIAQVQVNKAATAMQHEGSIGAGINLTTPKPFDLEAQQSPHFAGSIQATHNTTSQHLSSNQQSIKSLTPQAFALVSQSWQTSTGRVGLLGAVIQSRRDWAHEGFSTEGFRKASSIRVLTDDHSDIVEYSDVYIPRSHRIYRTEESRKQNSYILASQIEWLDPNTSTFNWGNALIASIDYFQSDFDIQSHTSGFQAFFEDTFTHINFDQNQTATEFIRPGESTLNSLTPEVRARLGGSIQGNDSIRISKNRPTKTQQTGVNLRLERDTSQWQLDYAYSTASNLNGGLPFSSQGYTSLGDASWQLNNLSNNAQPNIAPSYYPGVEANDITPESIKAHFLGRFNGNNQDNIHEFKADVLFEMDGTVIQKINAGLFNLHRDKTYTSFETTYPRNCAYCGRQNSFNQETLALLGTTPEAVFQPILIGSDFAGGLDGNTINGWYQYNINELTAILESETFINAGPANPNLIRDRLGITDSFSGVGFSALPLARSSYLIQEKVIGAYASVDLTGALKQINWELNIGARLASTQATAQGTGTDIVSIERAEDDDQLLIRYSPERATREDSQYTHLLPSFNLVIHATQNWLIRLGSSKTLSRPNPNDLGEQMSVVPRAGSASIYKGNIHLKPFESINSDIASEWYIAKNSFIGINLFNKRINNFVSNSTRKITIDDFSLNITQPQNQEDATASGLELALQHTFKNGFGGQFNYTHVTSSAEFFTDQNQQETNTFAIEGLSPNSFNIIAFYENEKLSARASYNWREEYLRMVIGPQSQPESAESFGQLDLNFRYHLTDNLSIFIAGINILEENRRLFSKYDNRVNSYEHTGARYNLGISAKF